MQEFYKKALLALIVLLLVDALLAVFFVYRAFPTRALLAVHKDGARTHFGTYSDVAMGGASTVRLHNTSPDRLRFEFTLRDTAYPFVAADLVFDDDKKQPVH